MSAIQEEKLGISGTELLPDPSQPLQTFPCIHRNMRETVINRRRTVQRWREQPKACPNLSRRPVDLQPHRQYPQVLGDTADEVG